MPEGKVKIKLEHDGTVLEVDEDDVEKVRLMSSFLCSYCVSLCGRDLCLSRGIALGKAICLLYKRHGRR